MTSTDTQIGGREHHRHRRLADVVLVSHVSPLIRRYWQYESDCGRRPRDVTGALPDRRKFLQLSRIGDDDEVPRLAVLRRRRPPAGLSDPVQIVFRYRLRLVLPYVAPGTYRIPRFHRISPSSAPANCS